MDQKHREGMRKTLNWPDIGILTVILFGVPIYSSSVDLFSGHGFEAVAEMPEVMAQTTYAMFIMQLIFLGAALLYLKWRKFDFSGWKCTITPKTTLYGIGLFLAVSLMMDGWFFAADLAGFSLAPAGEAFPAGRPFHGAFALLTEALPSVLYAALNGVYEELYFLGMWPAVPPQNMKAVFLFSLLVRFSFHTYQGLLPAAGIALILGSVYYLLYMKAKSKNMYPFFLSHAAADVLGLGLVSWFL